MHVSRVLVSHVHARRVPWDGSRSRKEPCAKPRDRSPKTVNISKAKMPIDRGNDREINARDIIRACFIAFC